MKTQGSRLYIIDPADDSVLEIECILNFSGAGAQRDQLDVTCLSDQARQFEAGLANPGQATFTLNFNTQSESHIRVHELWVSGDKFEMALGLSDGTAPPTVDTAGEFVFPSTRSFYEFHQAYFADVPQDLALNASVQANVSVQLSGFYDIHPKA